MTEYKKKLIEVALPLEAINRESAREKSIRHGHPSTLHLWWSRKPLATSRAILFASLVDDPSSDPERFPDEASVEGERRRLFAIIEDLVKWENSMDENVLRAAQAEIRRSCGDRPPVILDPFCGGGSIPLEAQRLKLECLSSDLNPVAVMVTKALVEIPPRFEDQLPVNPEATIRTGLSTWQRAQGLAEDVRYYGEWMLEQARERIGHLYPPLQLPPDQGSSMVAPIAWLWARVVKCPNPACGVDMPLVSKWSVATKRGKQVWIEPVIDPNSRRLSFLPKTGAGTVPAGTVTRQGATCVACGSHTSLEYIRQEGSAGRMSSQLLAVVGKGSKGRVYCAPDGVQIAAAEVVEPAWRPEFEIAYHPQYLATAKYGLRTFADLATPRQLSALDTFSTLVGEARAKARQDSLRAGLDHESAEAYSAAVATYLGFAVDRAADAWSSLAGWRHSVEATRNTFARQALPMSWDFAEANPFSEYCGNWHGACLDWIVEALESVPGGEPGIVRQLDASATLGTTGPVVVSTDPPYYDNIGYANLSDYFYVWLRHSLDGLWPEVFSTVLAPKTQEIVVDVYRKDGDRAKAQQHFEELFARAFANVRTVQDERYPATIYYAFRQAEESADGVTSTGWEAMLTGLMANDFAITGTWPVRSERPGRTRDIGSNAVASSIVLVCRPRPAAAALATRKDFLAALRHELPDALRTLQHGSIAPVDLAQASIGPGMAVFSRYAKVIEVDGSAMSVRSALALINQTLDEVVAEQEGEFDADTRWAIAWFQEFVMEAGDFGRADVLARAKNTSVQGLVEAGILEARAGKVRLLKRDELAADWDPVRDDRRTVWETTQHLIRRLDEGEASAANLARQLGGYAEVARELAYRLYLICERKKWAQEALSYNALVVAWPQIQQLAATEPGAGPSQTSFEV